MEQGDDKSQKNASPKIGNQERKASPIIMLIFKFKRSKLNIAMAQF